MLKNGDSFLYQQILNLAPAVIYVKDHQGRYTFINRHFELLSGLSANQVLGQTDHALFPDEVADSVCNNDRKVLQSGTPLKIEELGPVDGKMHTFLSAKFPLYDEAGRITGICGISTDITDRKKIERSLKESEERFRAALKANPDPVLLCDLEQRVVYSNSAFTRVFGWTRKQCEGRPVDQFIPKEHRHDLTALSETLFCQKTLPVTETRFLTNDNRSLLVEINGAPYVDEDGEHIGAILNIRDISVQKEFQKQILRARRLKSLHKLAGGIAHNFNNLLNSIQFSAELIKLESTPTSRVKKNLSNIFKCINSGAELTRQLLGMARTGKYVPIPLDINENILNCLGQFNHSAYEIKISWNLEKRVWQIEADRVQIQMVLTSLFNRAGQAMPLGGGLFISSENVTLNKPTAMLHNLTPGRYIKINVSDTGKELDHYTQEHIFDPFFADLSMANGKGLGLASAYGITRNHGGNITFESIRGKGTTFHVYLPAIQIPKPAPVAKPVPDKGASQTVLLVDDEKIVAETVAAMLKTIGFEVLVASNAEAALETFAIHKEKVKLVLLDMIIPGASGEEIFSELKEIDASIKIILCSGYSIHGEASRILAQGCDGFLQKPFSFEKLSAMIRIVLGQERQDG
jgi:PAS domain S-box-containing protein